jgi:ParB/RepB/Spo0J family partition protein
MGIASTKLQDRSQVVIEEKIEYLPLTKIETDENIRKVISEEELYGLMQSLAEVGQLQPIRVRPSGSQFKTTDGARRVHAARKAGWDRIAAIVENNAEDEAGAKQRALIGNCQRSDLTPLDTAEAVAELMERTGWNATDTATKLGFSIAKVSRLLALLKLPDTIRRQIQDGKIPASAGADLARVEDAAQQATLAEQLAAGRLTRDGLAGVVKRRHVPPKDNRSPAAPRISVALGQGRSVTLGGRGLDSLDTLITWLEELLAKARKCRPKGLELGTFIRILRDEAKAI